MNYYIYNGELYHYGVKGQKWGIRRYQNPDGSMTAAGKKRAKAEYKADNKKAFELGRDATITGHAATRSLKRTAKLESKLDKQLEKDPDGTSARTHKLRKKYGASTQTSNQLLAEYAARRTIAEAHCKELVSKYGKEAVSSIKYKETNVSKAGKLPVMNERTNKLSDYAKTGAASIVASAAMTVMFGRPIAAVHYPTTTAQKAADYERAQYRANVERSKNTKVIVWGGEDDDRN